MPEKTTHGNSTEWPPWMAYATAAIPVALMIVAVLQRRALWPPRWPLLIGFVAVVPWIAEAASQFLHRPEVLPHLGALRRGVPRDGGLVLPAWAFAVTAVPAVGALVWWPTEIDFAPFVLVFLAGQTAARGSRLESVAVTVASAAVMIGVEALGRFDGSFIWAFAMVFAWLMGSVMRTQERLTRQLREAQADLRERAAADERSRIAREVHDVIAHSMSVTMLHVTAARMALERGQSNEALDALREGETQGRNSLNDIRRTVGLLGSDDGGVEPPMPSALDLPKLVTDFQAAGLDVTIWMEGDARALPPAVGLNLYRITQESLTNIAKHAPGSRASVSMDVTNEAIRLLVRNGPGNGTKSRPPPSSGLGIKGMIERASMLGGSLAAGPDGEGWAVLLTAPRSPADSSP